MKVLFPNHPLKARLPDPDYEIELEAARNAGFECELYSFEDLRGGDAAQATRLCSTASRAGQAIVRFISVDIARQQDGSWLIVEVGDGGVSGLPSSIEPETFYRALYDKMKTQVGS